MKDQIEKLISEIEKMAEMAEAGSHDPLGSGPCKVPLELSISEANLVVHGLKALKPVEMTARKSLDDTEHRSPYQVTVAGMLSPDYKERFKAEYQQTKMRYEKLKTFCNRIEAAMRTCPGDTKRVQMPEHDCPLDLLCDQQRAMGEYLHCLEIRAVIEGIEL